MPANRGSDDRLFRELTQCLCGSLELQSNMKNAVGILQRCMPADGLYMGELDHVACCIRPIAWHSSFPYAPLTEGSVIQLPRRLVTQLTGTPHVVGSIFNHVRDDAFIADMHARYGIPTETSEMELELYRDERHMGYAVVKTSGVDRYTDAHLQQFEALRVPFTIALQNALKYEQVQQLRAQWEADNEQLRDELRHGKHSLIGERMGLRRVMDMVARVAPTDSPVVLLGETGSGKEVIANAVHERSKRASKPVLRVNCGAIPDALIESELFGHERGAFTGASTTRIGLFERAGGGTLFLDEVGELSPAAQVKLLRVLQTSQFERVGGSRSLHANVRLVAATHRDLPQMVRQGRFREDLLYRLNVFPISIPPLRERREDIPSLTRHFMQQHAREMGLRFEPVLGAHALEQLLEYVWPGNVRELRNVLERALILCRGEPLTFPLLGRSPRCTSTAMSGTPGGRVPTFEEATAAHIRRVLAATGARLKGPGGAAEVLGLPASTLRNKMKRLGL